MKGNNFRLKNKSHAKFVPKTRRNSYKNLAVLGAFSAFLITGIVLAKYGYRALSLCSFVLATGIVLFHLPTSYALASSFISVSLALTANFFVILNHYINGATLQSIK